MKKKIVSKVLKCILGIACVGMIYGACIGKAQAAEWKGDGTKENPYLLENDESLRLLAERVNAGEGYAGKYFKQTKNIDLKNQEWTPIGIFGSENYFYGVYDGDGHYVENLNIHTGENGSYFGMLGGTVMNFGIESGTIEGAYLGSISSHAAGNGAALIINCYNRASVKGARAGGIADNFAGRIINCWSDCKVKGSEQTGGIVSYGASTISCYGTQKEDHGSEYTQVSAKELNSEKFAKKMSEETEDVCKKAGVDVTRLNKWELNSKGKLGFSDEKQTSSFQGFSGDGSKESPYLIQTAKDLQELSYQVNIGNAYNGLWFRQTDNIDLKNESWTPIGIYGAGHYFYGIYDGDGHYVENLNANSGTNGSFFGMLGGTVMNFGIESGQIKGACLGSISSHAADGGMAKVLNCYNKASVSGDRAGGIVDNFAGQVFNCWNIGELSGNQIGGTSSYATQGTLNCYGVQDTDVSSTYQCVTVDEINSKDFAKKMRESIVENAEQYGMTKEDFNDWTIQEGKGLVLSKNKVTDSLLTKLMEHWKVILIVVAVIVIVLLNFRFQKILGGNKREKQDDTGKKE